MHLLEFIYFSLVLVQDLMSFVRSYVVPEGFPDSVIPSYVPYMTWRALKVTTLLFQSNIGTTVGL